MFDHMPKFSPRSHVVSWHLFNTFLQSQKSPSSDNKCYIPSVHRGTKQSSKLLSVLLEKEKLSKTQLLDCKREPGEDSWADSLRRECLRSVN